MGSHSGVRVEPLWSRWPAALEIEGLQAHKAAALPLSTLSIAIGVHPVMVVETVQRCAARSARVQGYKEG